MFFTFVCFDIRLNLITWLGTYTVRKVVTVVVVAVFLIGDDAKLFFGYQANFC